MRSRNKGLEPRKRFAPQQQKPVVTIDELVEQTMLELFDAAISAEQLAAMFSPLYAGARLPLHEAVEALEVIGAPPGAVQVLKEHLDVLAAVDAARRFDLPAPYTTDVTDIPRDILCGYVVDCKDIEPFISHIGQIPLEKAQELGEKLFGSRGPDFVISPYVLEDNRSLRGLYTFVYMLQWPMFFSIGRVLGEVFFANTEPNITEPYPFFLFAKVDQGRFLCVKPIIEVFAHGRVGDKYWVFFIMA